MNEKDLSANPQSDSGDIQKQIVADVKADFAARQNMRRQYELGWQLNMNFVMGNQYCHVGNRGAVEQEEKFYFWQEKQVFNHIAPLVEARVSRLNRIRPRPIALPFSSDETDVNAAKLGTAVLDAAREKLGLSELVAQAIAWSEVCGTAFYKVVWNNQTQDVSVCVCSPFEIYPDSNVAESLDQCNSVIHAKCYSAAEAARLWGVSVSGQNERVFATGGAQVGSGLGYNSYVPSIGEQVKGNQVLVLERYVRPSADYPNGRLQVVVGDVLAVDCDLPYVTGENGERGFPFIRQTSFIEPGRFWGTSVVERLIPVQRAYNAVKNRKHEFLNRIAMGVLTVEDGSVDTDNLEEEGLSPGKIIVYRRGSSKPELMDGGDVPAAFAEEEARLENEFSTVSGVSLLAGSGNISSTLKSGVALQLIAEQDDIRISASIDSVKSCIRLMAKRILRLYKQFVSATKLMRFTDGKGSREVFSFVGSDLSAEDVTFQTDNESSDTPATRRDMLFNLISAGVLTDENGKMSATVKRKILQIMGFQDLIE